MTIKSDAQRRAVARYNSTHYEQVLIRVEAGQKEEIKAHAESMGESLNAFLNRAVVETIERDNKCKKE